MPVPVPVPVSTFVRSCAPDFLGRRGLPFVTPKAVCAQTNAVHLRFRQGSWLRMFSWIGGPARATSRRGRRPRAARCGRLACPSAGLRPARRANDGESSVRMTERARRRERTICGQRAEERRVLGTAWKGREWACDGRWFWGRRRGNVWATDEQSGGSVCVRVGGLRARVQRVRLRSQTRRTPPTRPPFGDGEPAAACEFLLISFDFS